MINSGEVSGVVEALEQPIQGDVTPTQSLTGEVQHGSGVSGVRDVLVNEESVVDNNKVAHIDLTPYAEKEDVYDKQTIDTALEGKADKSEIPTELADLTDDTTHRVVTDEQISAWNDKADVEDIPTKTSDLQNNSDFVSDADYVHTDNNFTDADKSAIGNIPTALADLSDDSTHRLVTDTEKTTWNAKSDFSGSYNDLTDKPTIPSVSANPSTTTGTLTAIEIDGVGYAVQGSGGGAVSSVNGQTGDVLLDAEDVGALPDNTPLFSGSYNDLTDKPTIPDELADLQDDSTHRLVTDTEKSTWDNKSDFSGSYNDLTDKPTIPDAQIQSDWEQSDNTKVDFIKNKPTIPSAQVNSDWNASSGVAEILNKPTLGTASAKDSTNAVTQGSTDLVESGAVWSAIDNLPEPMIFKGTLGTGGTITTLPTASSSNNGYTYKVIEDGTYDGKSAKVGDVFTSNGSEWVLIPSGDETFTDTWRSVKVNGTELLGSSITTGAVNFKSGTNVTVSGSGNDITITAQDTTYSKATAQADGLMSKEDFSKLSGIASGAEANVQANWNETSSSSDAYIQNKPQNLVQDASYVHTDNNYTSTEKTKLSGIESGAQVNTITGIKGNAESSYRTGNVNITPTNIGLGNVDNTSDSTKKTNFTGSIASGNTGFTTGGDVYTALGNKVDKVTGKQLSTEDYTTAEKTKLSGISTGANKTEASITNGNIKIDSVETPVYRNYGNNAVLTTDKTPFLTRQTLNPTGFSGYVREKLVGASYAWNQLVQDPSLTDTSKIDTRYCTFTVSGGIATFTPSSAGTERGGRFAVDKLLSGRKYLVGAWVKCSKSATLTIGFNGVSVAANRRSVTANTWTYIAVIYVPTLGTTDAMTVYIYDSSTTSDTLQVTKPLASDLTLAFGSTIADYLYGLSNNGGITKLRDMGCPIDKYTPYGYGLYSVKTSGKKIVGKNLWDGEYSESNKLIIADGSTSAISGYYISSWIRIVGGLTYTASYTGGDGLSGSYIAWYDGGKNVIATLNWGSSRVQTIQMPSNACYMRVSYYKTTRGLQVEIGSSDTAYEPYSAYEISLGNDELRGKFDLVNGEIVASGDVKESNGNVNRMWDEVDLGSLTWTKHSSGAFYATLSSISGNDKAVCAKYAVFNSPNEFGNGTNGIYVAPYYSDINIKDPAYSSSTAEQFKTAMSGVKLAYEKSTLTTEQSTPFADPMSLVGATTEEYIDTRDIPCPVGAERQYMGQSEDVIEIPSGSLSDGKRKFVAETSGGKTQYYFEGEEEEDSEDITVEAYSGFTLSNVYAKKFGKVVQLSFTASGTFEYFTIMSVARITDNSLKPTVDQYGIFMSDAGFPAGGVWLKTNGAIVVESNQTPVLSSGRIKIFYIL